MYADDFIMSSYSIGATQSGVQYDVTINPKERVIIIAKTKGT